MADHTTMRRQSSGGNGGGGGGGDGGGMRTVDCLRGRLLAERVASKAAKEEADQLAQRLDELEKKLSDEVKMMSKAEKRLRRAVKKLESLGAGGLSAGRSLSSNGCAGQQAPEVVGEMNSPPASLSTVDSGPLCGGGSSAGSCPEVNSSQNGSWFSVVSDQSGSGVCKEENAMDPDDTKNCVYGEDAGGGGADHDSAERERAQHQPGASSYSSKSSDTDRDEDADRLALVLVDDPHHGADAGRPRTEDDGDARATGEEEDDSCRLAIVQADPAAAGKEEENCRLAVVLAAAAAGEEEDNRRVAIVLADAEQPPRRPAEKRDGGSTDVESVLLALRQVKEQLRCTIERRSPGLAAQRELCGH